jgi:hypothetical protein
MEKVAELQTAFYLRYSYTIQLRNIENGKFLLFHPNELGSLRGSPNLLTTQTTARQWLEAQDDKRLADAVSNRPNTKYVFQRWVQVEVKAVLTNQPLLGCGPLPDWLRNKRGLYALDTYDDNLCMFRCIAVHQGARTDRCTERAEALASVYWRQYLGLLPGQRPNIKDFLKIHLGLLESVDKNFKLGIRVYEPSEEGTWRLIRQPTPYEAMGTEPVTIGIYNEHAFLIRDITKVAQLYACAHCNQQFTQACHLQRHAGRCISGETKVICPGKEVLRPQSDYEKAFHPKSNASKGSLQWIEYEAQTRGLHIHHAFCGHGGECWITDAPVDGYEPTSKTVFQYHGCHFHGCPAHCKLDKAEQTLLLKKTRQQEQKIKNAGYNLVVVWECQNPPKLDIPIPEQRTVPYPILYSMTLKH